MKNFNKDTFFAAVIDGIEKTVDNKYSLDTDDAKSFLDDAGLSADEGRRLLTTVFSSLLVAEYVQLTECFNIEQKEYKLALFNCVEECLEDPDPAFGVMTEEDTIKELVQSSMSYACYEDWESIFNCSKFLPRNTLSINSELYNGNRELFGKAVSYLYDGYATA